MKSLIAGVAFFITCICTYATHLRCGYISVSSQGQLTVDIKILVYTNITSSTLFGGAEDVLDFGDGSTISVPETMNTHWDLLPSGTGFASFTVQHTYSSPGYYVVTYREPNRNDGILNFDNSAATPFYLETGFTLDPAIGAFSSPVPMLPPIFQGFLRREFSSSIAAIDGYGSELFYSLTTPRSALNTPVSNYQFPENLKIDRYNGLLTWDTEFRGQHLTGEYLFAVKIEQHKVIGGVKKLIGFVQHDVQVILRDEPNDGTLTCNLNDTRLYVPVNTTETIKVYAHHGAEEDVELAMFTEINEENISFEIYDSVSSSTQQPIKVGVITVTTAPSLERKNPYVISMRAAFDKGQEEYYKDLNVTVFTKDLPVDPIMSNEVSREHTSYTLAPNPATTIITIHQPIPEASSFEIISGDGRAAISESLVSPSIDISRLPSGIYIIRVKDAKGNILFSKRIIKL